MNLSQAIEKLRSAGVDAYEHDAKEIFIHTLSLDRYQPIDKTRDFASSSLEERIDRRVHREPLAYILGECWFYNEVYEVNEDVLVPRPDTEILVDFAVKNLPVGASFLDLCTGSGCVAISTLANTERTNCIAVDISEGALAVAERNAGRNGVSGRIRFEKADVMNFSLPIGRVHAVLSNPPYIPDAVCDTLSPEVMREPRIALAGGADGMDFYKRITPLAMKMIDDSGFIAFEIGYDEREAITALAEHHGLSIEIIKDYSANDRVAVLRKK